MVASVPTYRVVFHCRRLLSAGYKVAIVRQTETAAIRKSSKGSTSQTFERSVTGVFTSGTLVDDDDPAFDGLVTAAPSSKSAEGEEEASSGDEEVGNELNEDFATNDPDSTLNNDNRDHWIASYFECSSNSVKTNKDDLMNLVDTAGQVDSLSEFRVGALVAVCVRAHMVWIRTFALDTMHQTLVDYLEMLKPAEIVVVDSLCQLSRDIITTYFDLQRQQNAPDSMLEVGEMRATSSRIMQRVKWLPESLYSLSTKQTNSSSNASLLPVPTLPWSQTLSYIAQSALAGLSNYLLEFQLESTLVDPELNIHEAHITAEESSTTAASNLVSTTVASINEPKFPLDGVTVRDLELFDSFSNANEHLRGLSKLLRYQQQYEFHQQQNRRPQDRRSNAGQQHSILPGGLFAVLDRCVSGYGRRTLRQWLLNPLSEVQAILARQDAIEWLLPAFSSSASIVPSAGSVGEETMLRVAVKETVQSIQEVLRKAPDIEKMLTSLQFNRIAPARLKTLLQMAMRFSVLHIPGLHSEHRGSSSDDDDTNNNDLLDGSRQLFEQQQQQQQQRSMCEEVVHLLPCYLPVWMRMHLQKTHFLFLATRAASFDAKIVLINQPPSASVGIGSEYDAARIDNESLTGFFLSEFENTFPALAALRAEKHTVVAELFQELQTIRKLLNKPQLRYSSLRSGPLSSIDHLIELPLSEEKKAPKHWAKVNSTKQVVRFHVPTVLSLQDRLYRIRDECKIAGRAAWKSFVSEVKASVYSPLRIAIGVLGCLDAMLSLTQVAAYPGYVRPSYRRRSEESAHELHIVEGRHPVLERRFADSETPYLPNDLHLGNPIDSTDNSSTRSQRRLIQVVTGPNLGGKSSYCRMVALIALMGQIGSFVPAREAELVVFDNILTRMGSEDDLQSGRSTFLCELIRTNAILRHATAKSLIVIDELGRGTATHDGYAIAQATLWYILDQIRCLTLFITHFPHIARFPRISSMTDSLPNSSSSSCVNSAVAETEKEKEVVMSHMSYHERILDACTGEAEITFLYKLVESPSEGSYGINVARLAGMKKSILDRAMVKAREMQEKVSAATQWS
jgi:DNA mismatch repair ATPase MutS